MAQLVRLGMVTLEQARETPAGAGSVVLMTNPGDGAVSPSTVEDIVDSWRDRGADASVYEWPAEMSLQHNMVDDVVNEDNFDEIYPILIDMFTEGATG